MKEESELFSPISDPLTVSLKERLNSSGVASLQVSISSTSENEPDFVLTPGMVYPFTIELVADSGDVIDQILTPVIFTSEENSWHGLEKKKIKKERRCLQLNYVTFETEWPVD